MSRIWFDHISKTLAGQGMAAYVWNVTQDHIEWQGDLNTLIGPEVDKHPTSSTKLNGLINPQDVPQRLSALHTMMNLPNGGQGDKSFSSVYRLRRANGMQIDVAETGTLHSDEASGDQIVCGLLRVVDPLQYAQSAAKPLSQATLNNPFSYASYDTSMTHYGRLMICQKINEWSQGPQVDQHNGVGYLLVVGIDRISMLNEAFGAGFTDDIIEQTGKRLRHIIGDSGVVARIGGDVFAMFFNNAPHAEMAAVAHHLLHRFSDQPIETNRGPLGVGVSIGGVLVNRPCKVPADMLTKAEMALQSAKERGRGRFISYTEAAGEAQNTRKLLESGDAFLRALKEDRLRLAFQPIINAKTSAVSFHESLIRFYDEQGKMHSAGNFMPAIERLGLSRLVDRYALGMAIKELVMFSSLSLSVNVSPLTLNDPDWLRGLVSSLRERPDVAGRLIVEITESAIMLDMAKTIRLVDTLRSLGCRVALDDFGAGYTAFSQMKDLDISFVKIDKSFVRNIGERESHLFVRTLHALADGVDIETVAEGAETMNDARLLTEEGIHHIQGYVFGFPSVERVWLPKEHHQRKIILPTIYDGAIPSSRAIH